MNNHQLNRRTFLKGASATTLAASTLPLQAAATARGGSAKSVIYVYVGGGLSHLDSFDIKPENSSVRGEAGALRTSADGVRISKFFPKLAKQMHHVAVVNSLTTTQGAHAQGKYYMHTSYVQRSTVQHPELGAWASKYLEKTSPTLPAFVKVGARGSSLGAGFFAGKYGALPIGDPLSGLQHSAKHSSVRASQFQRRMNILKNINGGFASKYDYKLIKSYDDAYRDAVQLMNSADLEAFDIKKEKDSVAETYGQNTFGRSCLLARRLVEKGVRFVEVNSGNWEHHGDIYDDFPDRARELDQGLAALLNDLSQRGLLDSTMVVLATEFGRSPQINGNGGRNHYPKAFSGLLAGGGIRGGQVYGKTDSSGGNVISNKVQVPDFNATIAHGLGMDLKKVVMSPSGRPFQVAHRGKPIRALF